jgi:hypothetical protein
MRCAVFAPRPASAIDEPPPEDVHRDLRQLHAWRQLQPGHGARHLFIDRNTHAVRRVVDGSRDQVLEHLALLAHQRRLDLHARDLVSTVHRHLDHAATRLASRGDLAHLGLGLLQVLLHGLGLLHQIAMLPRIPVRTPIPGGSD